MRLFAREVMPALKAVGAEAPRGARLGRALVPATVGGSPR
jgi:hypothetical protein